MSDPRRLRDEPGNSDFERSLLDAWKDEQPAPKARAQLLALTGLAAGSTVAGAGAAAGSMAPKAAGGVAVAKWLAIGVLAASATGATALALRTPEPHRIPTSIAVGAPPATAALTATAPDSATAAATPPTLAPQTPPSPPVPTYALPQTPASPPAPPAAPLPVAAKPREPTVAASGLSDQVAAMDRARAALEAGDAARALRLADEYRARYPAGAFQPEADVLRIEALVRQGDRDQASKAAARFLSLHPQSPHAAHVRALLGI